MKQQNELQNRITSFQIGPNAETDVVCAETVLQKLAMTASVVKQMEEFILTVVENDGTCPELLEAPDSWAVSGVWQNLSAISHALKCGAFGYKAAFMH